MSRAITLALLLGLNALLAPAMPATDVFRAARKSVVVVHALDAAGEPITQGSGVIVSSKKVVTNWHVVEDAASIRVLANGQQFSASVVRLDQSRDLCELTVPDLPGTPIATRTLATLEIGETVFAVGAPLGLELTISDGIVSALRHFRGGRAIQFTAPISQGSSGGALVDVHGQLVGITTFVLVEGQSLNFALPTDWISELPFGKGGTRRSHKERTALRARAFAQQSAQDWKTMASESLAWTRTHPDDVLGWFFLGTAHHRSGRHAAALRALKRGVKGKCGTGEDIQLQMLMWFSIGRIHEQKRDRRSAIDAYEQAFLTLPLEPMFGNLWSLIVETGLFRRGEQVYTGLVTRYPRCERGWVDLGSTHVNLRNATKGVDAFRTALQINPENERAWMGLYLCQQMLGNKSGMLEAYLQIKKLSPETARSLLGAD